MISPFQAVRETLKVKMLFHAASLGSFRQLSSKLASKLSRQLAAPSRSFSTEPWDEIYTAHPIDPNEKTFDKILIANRGEIACR